MTIDITHQIRIQQHQDFWYTVEDTHLDVGCDGCTISYWAENNPNYKKQTLELTSTQYEALKKLIESGQDESLKGLMDT